MESPSPNDLAERQRTLLRRFLPDPANGDIVPAAAFRPNRNDHNGISVSFHDFPHPISRVLADTRRPRDHFSVCEFDLAGMSELTAEASPTESDPGHATIPQICPPYDELKQNDQRKLQIRGWTAELARRSKIIHNAGAAIEP